MKVSLSLASVPLLALVLPGCSSAPIRPDPPPSIHATSDVPASEEVARTFRGRLDRDINLVLAANRQLSSPLGLGSLALGVAEAAPLASTMADQVIRDCDQPRLKRNV